jgi:hypothetical protein
VLRADYYAMFAWGVCESGEPAVDLGCDLSHFDPDSANLLYGGIRHLRLSEQTFRSAVMRCSGRVEISPTVHTSSSLLTSVLRHWERVRGFILGQDAYLQYYGWAQHVRPDLRTDHDEFKKGGRDIACLSKP